MSPGSEKMAWCRLRTIRARRDCCCRDLLLRRRFFRGLRGSSEHPVLRCEVGVDRDLLLEFEKDDELVSEREIGVKADCEDGREKLLSERATGVVDKLLSERTTGVVDKLLSERTTVVADKLLLEHKICDAGDAEMRSAS